MLRTKHRNSVTWISEPSYSSPSLARSPLGNHRSTSGNAFFYSDEALIQFELRFFNNGPRYGIPRFELNQKMCRMIRCTPRESRVWRMPDSLPDFILFCFSFCCLMLKRSFVSVLVVSLTIAEGSCFELRAYLRPL